MSSIVSTEAIVLKSMKYRETSKIVTFYTRLFGKVSGIVKGARQVKSKYGSSLELMSYVSLVLYKKEGRDLHAVSQCDVMKPFPRLVDDLSKMAVGVSIVELVNIVAHEEEENVPLFRLVVDSLTAVNDATKNPVNLFYCFEVHLARVLGFQPLFNHCISCRKADFLTGEHRTTIEYHLDKGGPLCEACSSVSGHRTKLTRQVYRVLERMSTSKTFEGIQNIEISERSRGEIENFLWLYLSYHISGMRQLKSGKVFSKILSLS